MHYAACLQASVLLSNLFENWHSRTRATRDLYYESQTSVLACVSRERLNSSDNIVLSCIIQRYFSNSTNLTSDGSRRFSISSATRHRDPSIIGNRLGKKKKPTLPGILIMRGFLKTKYVTYCDRGKNYFCSHYRVWNCAHYTYISNKICILYNTISMWLLTL